MRRLKHGEDSLRLLSGGELRRLRRLRREQPARSRYVFVTDRGVPMTRNGFFKLRGKAAAKAGLADVHPHLLRHAAASNWSTRA